MLVQCLYIVVLFCQPFPKDMETAPKTQVSISEMQDWADPEALHCDSL